MDNTGLVLPIHAWYHLTDFEIFGCTVGIPSLKPFFEVYTRAHHTAALSAFLFSRASYLELKN